MVGLNLMLIIKKMSSKNLSKEQSEKLDRVMKKNGWGYKEVRTPRYDETESSLSKTFLMIGGIALFFFICYLIISLGN